MVPASCIALTNPRHALDRSKFRHDEASPNWWWTSTAALGSRWSRHTDVSINIAIRLGSIPDSAIAFAPAITAASTKLTSSGHHRRSSMPATVESIPARKPVRS